MASFPAGLMEQIADARHSVARLRTALISVGVVLIAAALALIIFKAPGGILLRLHDGRAAALVYYGVLGAVAIHGTAEVSFGYWVVLRDMGDWRAVVGKKVLWISVLLLALVASLGGLAFLKY